MIKAMNVIHAQIQRNLKKTVNISASYKNQVCHVTYVTLFRTGIIQFN